jgi:hypothetical protein|tara:strand:+ start:256 stop:1245 length:990 start_codon:yes stop_codon:yes gene_type:complete
MDMIYVKRDCPDCIAPNFIYDIKTLLINKCRVCGSELNDKMPFYDIDTFMDEYFPQGTPDVIPLKCDYCDYFKKTGWFDQHKGYCDFFKGKTYSSWKCVVTRIENEFEKIDWGKSIKVQDIECPNCNKPQNDNAIFCKDCGTEISPKELATIAYCDKCDTEYDISYKFCEKDGKKLKIIEIEEVAKGQVVDVSSHSKEEIKETRETVGADEVQEKKTEPGFVWGNIWITLCFIQSIVFLIAVFGVPDEAELIVGFLFTSVFAFGTAFGLLRRKIWGLYLTYFVIIINYGFGGLFDFNIDEPLFVFRMIALLSVGVLWWTYFNKRKEMFS